MDVSFLLTLIDIVISWISPLQRCKVSCISNNHLFPLQKEEINKRYKRLLGFLLCHPSLNFLHFWMLMSKVLSFTNIEREFYLISFSPPTKFLVSLFIAVPWCYSPKCLICAYKTLALHFAYFSKILLRLPLKKSFFRECMRVAC